MLFNSAAFLLFFAVVYPTYLALRRYPRAQNAALLLASLVFYGAWDWRFLALLAGTTSIDYFVAQWIHDTDDARRKRWLLLVSITVNLAALGLFKYFNFFAGNAAVLLHALGMRPDRITLSIALPVGISFYTFQAMSYIIEVYRGDLKPSRSPLDYALFIAFFPHLVAGPIQRPTVLLPQVQRPRTITSDQVHAGLFLILWGYFQKVVVADNLAPIANGVFDHSRSTHGLDVLIGALAFTFQIYGDFSGYSDIARGLSKLMGFELLVNFKLPYFAVNPTDFWLRWHVSLSTWLRDYLYVPLGGNRNGPIATYQNLFLTMLLGGLWHGAAWTFVAWGAFHGIVLVIYRLVDRAPCHDDPWAVRGAWFRIPPQMLLMFSLTVVGWVLFRSRTIHQAMEMFLHTGITPSPRSSELARKLALFTLPLLAVHLWQYVARDLLIVPKQRSVVLAPIYGSILAAIVAFGSREHAEFIYFKF